MLGLPTQQRPSGTARHPKPKGDTDIRRGWWLWINALLKGLAREAANGLGLVWAQLFPLTPHSPLCPLDTRQKKEDSEDWGQRRVTGTL